jgi:hypothetical protein
MLQVMATQLRCLVRQQSGPDDVEWMTSTPFNSRVIAGLVFVFSTISLINNRAVGCRNESFCAAMVNFLNWPPIWPQSPH